MRGLNKNTLHTVITIATTEKDVLNVSSRINQKCRRKKKRKNKTLT